MAPARPRHSTAGAAALLAQARPDLDAGGLKQALVASARRGARATTGTVDPSAAASSELVSMPPAVPLGVALKADTTLRRTITLRNVSRRALDVVIEPGGSDAADITVDTDPASARLRPGSSLKVLVAAVVPLLPRAPSALDGVLRVKVRGGATLRNPWTIAVPLPEARSDRGGAALEPLLRAVRCRAGRAHGRRGPRRTGPPTGRSSCRSA